MPDPYEYFVKPTKEVRPEIDHDHCVVCGVKIETMTFKGTGVCSNKHMKVRDGDKISVVRY